MTDSESTEDESIDIADLAAISRPYKVLGKLPDVDGIGVIGKNTAGSGSGIGVRGVTEADPGVETSDPPAGVVGEATSGANRTRGVEGITDGDDGAGVYGLASNQSGGATGVIGETNGTGEAVLARGDARVRGTLNVKDLQASAYLGTSQGISGGLTRVEFDKEVVDDRNEYDDSTNYEFTCQDAGTYHVEAQVRWGSVPGSGNSLELVINQEDSAGVETRARTVEYVASDSWDGITVGVSKSLKLFDGEKVFVKAGHSDGTSSYSLQTGEENSYLTVTKIG